MLRRDIKELTYYKAQLYHFVATSGLYRIKGRQWCIPIVPRVTASEYFFRTPPRLCQLFFLSRLRSLRDMLTGLSADNCYGENDRVIYEAY